MLLLIHLDVATKYFNILQTKMWKYLQLLWASGRMEESKANVNKQGEKIAVNMIILHNNSHFPGLTNAACDKSCLSG